MAVLHTIDDVLNDIFASYMLVKSQHVGRYDREFRHPQHLVTLARDLGALPPRERTVRVTGSKGKGTTSRLIARYLQHVLPNERVGLLVSPEEFTHLDRMQIDGTAIPEATFIAIYNELRPRLNSILNASGEGGYLSPSGVFMLIALIWFHREGVVHYVLETGRGAQFDEVGQIGSAVSVVTSIFLEHAGNLGPALTDIAADKLSIAASSDLLVCPREVQASFRAFTKGPVAHLEPAHFDECLPHWLSGNDQLARTAAKAYLAERGAALTSCPIEVKSPSFMWATVSGSRILIEAIISGASADEQLYAAQFKPPHAHTLFSLPDDKDREHLIRLWKQHELICAEVALCGTRGYLNYKKAKSSPDFLSEVVFNDPAPMRKIIEEYIARHKPGTLYLAGTQTYIRLVKQALKQEL